MLKSNKLLDYTNRLYQYQFHPNIYEKNNKIILKCFE